MKKRMIACLCIAPFLAALISLFVGRYTIPFQEVFCILLGNGQQTESVTVVLQLRLPRIIAAAFVGAGLAASGTAFQGVFQNPLVSSGLLGVSAGAGFGAALAIVLLPVAWATYPVAFAFGVLAVLLSYWIARIYKTVPPIMLVLGGTIVTAMFQALLSLLKYVADPERQLPAIVYWLMGSLSSVGYGDFWALIPISLGLLVLLILSHQINVLAMGEKEARTLGVDVARVKTLVVGGAALATAGSVCLAGMVGWVGLVIPHIGRMIGGNDASRLLPISISMGATFLILMDTLSRVLVESEVPLGILTALVGAPFFVFLLKKTKGGGWQI